MANNNYRILLQAVIDEKSVQTQLDTLSKKYNFNVSLKVNDQEFEALKKQIESLKKQLNNIYSGTSGRVKLIDGTQELKSLDELQRKIKDVQDSVNNTNAGKIDIKTTFDEKGQEQVQQAVLTYTDQTGKSVREVWLPAVQEVEGKLERTGEFVKAEATYVNEVAKIEKARNRELEKSVQYAEQFLERTKDLKQTDSRVIEGKDLSQKIINVANDPTLNAEQRSQALDKLTKRLKVLDSSIRQSGNSLYSWGKELSIALSRTITWATSIALVQGAIHGVAEGMKYIMDLNKEMTNIQILQVDGAKTNEQISNLAKNYNELAQSLSVTTVEVAKGSVEWLRQGKTIQETTQLTKASMVLSKLGAMESAEATQYLTSIINGYKLSADDAIKVVDKLIAIDNKAATSSAEMAEALQRTANIAQMAGVGFDDLIGYVATVSQVTRKSASTIGESFKTIFTRMQNIKLGSLDDDGKNINDVEKALSKVNIQLRISETEFRDMDDVLAEVASKWGSMNEVQKASVAQAIAGTRQYENLIALLNNWNTAESLRAEAMNATGTAMNRYQHYQDNIEASAKRMQAALEGAWQKTITPTMIKGWYDLIGAIFKAIDAAGGFIPVILTLGGALVFLNAKASASAWLGFINGIKSAIAALQGMTIAAEAAGTATAMAFGVIGVVLGVAVIAYNAIANSAERTQEKIASLNNEIELHRSKLSKAYTDVKRLSDVWGKYENLEKQSQKTQEYYDVMLDIKDILPQVNGYYDAQGRFILDNTLKLSDLLQLKEREIELEREKIRLLAYDTMKTQLKGYKDQINALNELRGAYNNYYSDAVKKTLGDRTKEAQFFGFGTEEELKDKIELQQNLVNSAMNDIRSSWSSLSAEQQEKMLSYLETLNYESNWFSKIHTGFGDSIANELTKASEGTKQYMNLQEKLAAQNDKTAKTFNNLKSSISGLQEATKLLYDISGKQFDGGISFEDVSKLLEAGDEYIDLLEIENGLITVNTDKIKKLTLQKAQDALLAAQVSGATEKEVAILQNYVDQAERAIPISKEYLETFQGILTASGEQMGGTNMPEQFKQLGLSISEITSLYEEGKISAKEYFDTLNAELQNVDMNKMFEGNEGAAQTFFTGLTLNAAQSLSQLSSMFDSGKITIVEYSDALLSLTGVFDTLGGFVLSFSDSMGLSSDKATEMQSVVGGALEGMTESANQLRQMSELNSLVQEAMFQVTREGLQQGTEAYDAYMQKIAQAAEQANFVYTDLDGRVYKSAGDIQKYLQSSTGNFMKFAKGTGNTTGKAIQGIVQNVGKIFQQLGQAISSFKGTIHITPKLGQMINFQALLAGNIQDFFKLPSIDIEIGTSGMNFSSIGNMVAGIGDQLVNFEFNFDEDIYTVPDVIDQVSDAAGGASDAYDNLSKKIKEGGNAADDAAKKEKDALDALLKKIKAVQDAEKDRLKDQLDAYKKLIDSKKKLLDQEERELEYQAQVEEQQKNILDLKNELAELGLDDSEEAKARRLQLEEELAKLEKKLEDTQRKKSIEDQKKALDEEYELFKDQIDKKLDAIEDFLKKLSSIEAETVEELLDKLSEMGITVNVNTGEIETHHSGINSGFVGGSPISKESERFAKLMKGELVLNPNDMGNFFSGILPNLMGNSPQYSKMGMEGGCNIENLIRIDGNATEDTIPSLEEVARRVVEQLNDAMFKRGFTRKANSFGG